jgi:hypothetical protein
MVFGVRLFGLMAGGGGVMGREGFLFGGWFV